MGLLDTISRGFTTAVGAAGGFVEDIFQGAFDSFNEPGKQTSTGGWGGRIGTSIGDLVEDLGRNMIERPTTSGGRPTAPGETWRPPMLPPDLDPGPDAGRTKALPETLDYRFPWEAPVGPAGEEVQPMAAALALPGGALIKQILTGLGTAGGLGQVGEMLGLMDVPQPTGGPVGAPYGGRFFRMERARLVPRSFVAIPNPNPNARSPMVYFKNVGQPILFSGDLTSCKRVRKIAARARRARGGR